jgi:hypothetical protein
MNDFESQIAHDERLLSLYRYWSDKRRGRSMPARADLKVPELRPWLGYVNLVEVSRDPLDFRYRVFGTHIAEAIGIDLTGESISQNPNGVAELRQGYEEVVERKAPLYQVHEMAGFKGAFRHHRILLPLSDDDETVNMVLVLSYPLARPAKD